MPAVGNATISSSFPGLGAPYSVGVEELVTYVGDPVSPATPRFPEASQNIPWLVSNVSDLSAWADNEAGRWLGVHVFAPHYRPTVAAVRCLHFHDAQHVIDAILDFAPGGPPEVAMTCVPTRPQCSSDAGSVLRFPTFVRLHPLGPHVAVLLDLRLVGGHRFACILPAHFTLHTLLAFAESMASFSEQGLLVYVGATISPHRQDSLRLRDGDVLLFARTSLDRRTSASLEGLLAHPSRWMSPADLRVASATEGLLVQYLQERFFMPPHHHSGQDAVTAVCGAYDVQPSECVTCAFCTGDLEFRGNACSHVLGLFTLPLAHLNAPPNERRRDFVVLCDFRPVGYSPRAALVHVPILHLPSIAALFGIRVPSGYRLRSLNGTQAGDEVEFVGHQVLTFVFEECPDTEARVEAYVTLDDLVDGSPPYHDVPVHFRASDRSQASAAGRRGSQEVHRSRSRRGRSTTHPFPERAGAKPGLARQHFPHADGLDRLQSKAFMWSCGLQQDVLEEGAHDFTPICPASQACPLGPWFTSFAWPVKLASSSIVGLCQVYKLLTEPESNSLPSRDRVEAARDFVEGEGRVWPFLPAHDPHALQRIAERAEEEAQTLDSEEAAEFTMCLLTPGYLMEEVVIALVPPAEVPDALQLTQDARDPVRRRLFPSLTVVDPQPSQGYGVLIALPGWATPEVVICFSLLDVDERLFAASVPAVASRERLLAIADLSPPDLYDVYLEGSPTPMQVGEEAPMALGLCVFCMNRHELPGPYFHLPETLLTSMVWDDNPALPYGPDDGHMCYVGECSMRRVPLPADMPLPDNSQVAAAFGIQLSSMLVQPASPITRDVTMEGYYCYNVCAAYCPAAGETSDRSCIILVDCRAMLQGWQLVFCPEGMLTRAQLVEDLSTFAPAGWEVHLEGLAGADDIYDVTPGQVVYASYVLIPHHWQPYPGQALGSEHDVEPSIGDSSDPAGSSMESSLSSDGSSSQHPRSRSPYRDSTHIVSGSIAEVPFVLLGQEYAPELVVVPLSPNADVDQVLEQVQARRDITCRERFGRIVPVHPQPSGAYALAVVQPPWSQELLVVFDCLRVTEAIYCWVASPAMTRAAILAVVGVPNTGEFEVYAPDSDLPMGPTDVCQLQTGSCVSVIPSTCPMFVVAPLADMLLSGAGWDTEATLPCVPGEWLHVLSDTGPVSLQLAAGTPEAVLPDVAEAIGLPVDRASLQFAAPPLTDFADEGRLAWNIAAVTRTGALPENPERCVYFIDMRAILCGLTWAATPDGTVSVALIREQCGRAAAGGRLVEIIGGRPFHGREDIVWVWPGAVLRVHVVTRTNRIQTPAAPASSLIEDMDVAEADDSATSAAGPSGMMNDAPHGHTLMVLAAFFMLALCVGAANQNACLVACLLHWRRFRLPAVACLLALSAGMPCAESVQFRPFSAGCLEGGSSSGCAFPDRRCLPTPCRANAGLPRVHGDHGAPSLTCLDDLDQGDGALSLGLITLLEACVRDTDGRPFFEAAALVETLVEHFAGLGDSPACFPDAHYSLSYAHTGSGQRVELSLDSLIGRPEMMSRPSALPVSAPMASEACNKEPQFFDLTRSGCSLPGEQGLMRRFFDKVAFSSLLTTPVGLERSGRFDAWVQAGMAGRSPGPSEDLVLTSDGSFKADSSSAGWGIAFSLRGSDQLQEAGQFVGCLFGSLAPFSPFVGHAHSPDAYDAEVAGLLWCAVALAQLPIRCRVVIRADNVSALWGAAGMSQMRASPFCAAARALHASVGIVLQGRVSYEHVRGHSGEVSNELADALAAMGASGRTSTHPFRFDVQAFLREDGLVSRWLPHFAMSTARAHELPPLHDGAFSWESTPGEAVQTPGFSMRPFLRAFPELSGHSGSHGGTKWIQLCVASFNVLSLAECQKEKEAGLHGSAGRPSLLRDSLHSVGVHVAGLQECRTPAATMTCGSYSRFASGCDESSCFGVELWVSSEGPCPPESVVVLHTAPTILIASARLGQQAIRILVGHAPHRGHSTAARAEWWRATSHLCHSYSKGVPWIFLLDGNCRIGSRETSAVGAYEADPEDDAGTLLNDLLVGFDMCIPATFATTMFGAGGTLFQKRTGELDRSDYACVPSSWLEGGCQAWVDPGITAGHGGLDHLATVCRCAVSLLNAPDCRPRAQRIDARALSDPANTTQIADIIKAAPRPTWATEVSEHAAIVVDYLYTSLVRFFPQQRRRLRASYFSEETLALHQAVADLRHAVRSRTQALRCTYIRCAFLAWRSESVDFCSLFHGGWLWDLRVRLGHNCMLLRRFGRRLRYTCKNDKATYLGALSDEVAKAPTAEIHRAVQRVLRPRKFRKAANDPLPRLLKSDGTFCSTSAEVADTWRDHFRVLEGGVLVDAADLERKCRSFQSSADRPDVLEVADMPSWTALESAFRHSAPRKASGPDLLPPAICRSFSAPLTELFWPLLLKSVCYAAEPVGMKGGVMFHINKGKPGSQSDCAAHRGILAQSCLSKVFHRSLRGLVVNHWSRHSMPLQIGGKSGCSAAFGHLCSRSVLSFARASQKSAGLLFVDLQSAYYAVIRETVLGGGLSERPLVEVASALGLDSEDLQILKHYAEDEPVLQQQDACPMLLAMARELHRQTWFVLAGDSQSHIVETQRGTRPGGTLADVLFNVLFAKVLSRRRQAGSSPLSPQIPWSGDRTPFPVESQARSQVLTVTDMAHADDLCTPVICDNASHLRGAVSSMTADTMDVLTPHALRPNLGPTKTAAVFAPVGRGSREARREAFVSLKGRTPVWPDSKGLLWLDLVPRYRHLGSIVTHDCKMGPEIRHRLALASSAFREGKRRLFACKAIPLQKRAVLFRTHVLSVLLSGAGSWPKLSTGEWQTFRGGVLGFYRQLLCLRSTGDWRHTEAQIFAAVGLPSAGALLHAERLRFLRQLVCSAPDHVWALLSWYRPFQEGIRDACRWLYSLIGTTVPFGPLEDCWGDWSEFIKSRPGHWKGLIRRAEASDIERNLLTAAYDRAVRAAWEPVAPPPVSPMEGMEHACLLCGLAFASQQQWGAHAQRKHGYRNAASRLAVGRRCLACGMQYSSQARLKNHLLASAKCRHALEDFPPAAPVPPILQDGHVQAPSVQVSRPGIPVSNREDFSLGLMQELRQLVVADDQQIYDVVASFVEPLPVLRRTLQLWVETPLPDALASSAQDVLLVLKPDLVCSQVQGKLPVAAEVPAFDPLIVPTPSRGPITGGTVCVVGPVDHAWLAAWNLMDLPRDSLDLAVTGCVPESCSGLCVTLPPAPLCAESFLRPASLPLKTLRLVNAWTSRFLAALPHVIRTASRGVPVLLRVPAGRAQFEPVSTWLLRASATIE
ncbi:unnamed protein product, partial [Symbiodinium necroappetens]